MAAPTQAPAVRRFGAFEINFQSGELRKNGIRLRLSGQPFQVLAVLVERSGELVTREELHSALWPADTFVDFDHGLNNAVGRIREVLEDSSESPRYVETIPRRGYRFIASLADTAAPAVTVPQLSVPNSSIPAALTSTKRSRFLPVLLGVAIALAIIAVGFAMYRNGRAARHSAIQSLAVLPLMNLSGDPNQEYIADGVTEALIGRLAGIRDLRVISRTSAMQFKNTPLSVPEIARILHVDAIVEGSVMREHNRIRVTAQLIRGATDEHFWSESYDRELREVLDLESEVAQAIARKVEVTVTGDEQKRLAGVRPVSPVVYENYLRGRFALANRNNRSDVEESIRYFEEAIHKDPTFAPSYLGLANAYFYLGTVFIGGMPAEDRPKAIQAARKSLELDPELVEAHVTLGNMLQTTWHWSEAEAEYRRALEMRPNLASAYWRLGVWLYVQGRTNEALGALRRGRELDPLAVSGSEMGWALFYARHYDEAVQELRSALAVRPDDAYALWILGFALVAKHEAQAAVPVLEKAVSISDRSPGIMGLLVYAYAQAGRRADALRLLEELKQRRRSGYVPSAAFIKAYLGLGDYNQAFVWLEEGYKEQSNLLQFLKVHPIFDPVRSQPRFADLIRRVGL